MAQEPKIFAVWPYMEKDYQPLIYTNGRTRDSASPKLSFVCSKSKFREVHIGRGFIVALHGWLYWRHKQTADMVAPVAI